MPRGVRLDSLNPVFIIYLFSLRKRLIRIGCKGKQVIISFQTKIFQEATKKTVASWNITTNQESVRLRKYWQTLRPVLKLPLIQSSCWSPPFVLMRLWYNKKKHLAWIIHEHIEMLNTAKTWNSFLEFNRIIHKNGQTSPMKLLLFQLYGQLLDILQCPVELPFIRAAATQFECDRSCWMDCPCSNFYQL